MTPEDIRKAYIDYLRRTNQDIPHISELCPHDNTMVRIDQDMEFDINYPQVWMFSICKNCGTEIEAMRIQ